MSAPPPHPGPFVDTAPADRFCDLVLTGGVTSGVVYPAAAIELARAYRFKHIGGASAGAIAAALTAAAEYQRGNGSTQGFDVLGQIPEALASLTGGKTTLLSLFQPAAQTRRLFDLCIGLLGMRESGSGADWAARAIGSTIWAYRGAALQGVLFAIGVLVVIALLTGPPGGLGIGLSVVLGAVVRIAMALSRDVTHGLVANDFGLCNGRAVNADPKTEPAMVEWLHGGIQAAAGLPADRPLTFADLQGPVPAAATPGVPPDASIHLRMVTTNLTHGRPYRLPLTDTTSRLFYLPSELARFFPAAVMNHLQEHSAIYAPVAHGDPPADASTVAMRELPALKLPVVVAARLSLSFPFLFSAVPLWAIDYERPVGDRQLRRCWFSDGGISSNFPIHFFDSFVPRWPTFGISLGKRSRHWKDEPVWLPRLHSQGRGDAWNRFDEEASPGKRLVQYALAILASAKDWNDTTSMRMPGVRDRVVRIGFEAGEGSLNLGMTSETIRRIARDYGSVAGQRLVEKFAPAKRADQAGAASAPGSTDTDAPNGWDEHRWVRFNVLIASLSECIGKFSAAADFAPHSTPLRELIARAHLARPLRGTRAPEAPLSAGQADALDQLHTALAAFERGFAPATTAAQPYAPQPRPELRNRPPL